MQKEPVTFYKKVGTKFEPIAVHDPEYSDSLEPGFWLVHVTPDSRHSRFEVHPNLVEALAAFDIAREAMITAMSEASEYKPDRPLTNTEQYYWQKLCKNGAGVRFMSPSLHDIVDAGRQEFIKHLYVSAGPIQDKINRAIKAMEEPDGKSISTKKKVTKTNTHDPSITSGVLPDNSVPNRRRKRNNSRSTAGTPAKVRKRKS